MKLLKISTITVLMGASLLAQAEIIETTKVSRLYVQSTENSEAHAIRINKSIDSSCNGRLYIDLSDKELFSTILAYKISGTEFNLMYSKNSPGKTIAGHLVS